MFSVCLSVNGYSVLLYGGGTPGYSVPVYLEGTGGYLLDTVPLYMEVPHGYSPSVSGWVPPGQVGVPLPQG